MASKNPIPLATLGANPDVAKQIQALLLPEYDRPSPPPFPLQPFIPILAIMQS